MARARKGAGVLSAFLSLTLTGFSASAQSTPAPFLSWSSAAQSNPQLPVPPIFAHAFSAPIRISVTVQSACSFIGNTGSTVTMSCSINTPLAAALLGAGLLAGPRSGTFALSASGRLSQQNLNPFCGADLSIPPDPQPAGGSANPAPYFSTFEVCF